jgi:hypothetical protein
MEKAVEDMRQDLMDLFRNECRKRDEVLTAKEEKLDERARLLALREADLYELYTYRRTIRHHLLLIETRLCRLISVIESCKTEQRKQETDLHELSKINSGLKEENVRLAEMNRRTRDDLCSLTQLLNT